MLGNTKYKQAGCERGFTLLEILITVVVLSIGLMGLAGLQARGLQFNQSALMRSEATVLAYDMLDRMRANLPAARAGNYDQAMADSPPAPPAQPQDPNVPDLVFVAKTDVIAWLAELGRKLPGGDGAITVNNANDIATIQVLWDDNRDGVAEQTFTVESQL